MKPLSRFALGVEPSATMAIDTMFKQMKAEGQDVIGFGAGEPDFSTPDPIKLIGIKSITNNETKYTSATGTLELREAICKRLQIDYGVSYEPHQVAASNGAKVCVCVALQVLCEPGDEVILPAPYWVSYIELVRMIGAVPVIVEGREEDNFQITPDQLEKAITPKTKAIIFNNPSNPTGMIYSPHDLKKIADVLVKNEVYIIADEIYADLIYDGKFSSMASLGDEIKRYTILINGVSKSYAMTGWRIGYVAAPENIAKVIGNFLSHSTGSPCSISQKAAAFALTEEVDSVEEMRLAFMRRRNIMVEGINSVEGVSCLNPQGAFYVMMNISQCFGRTMYGKKIETCEDFCSLFLKFGKVAVVPGTSFGAPKFVRWSYAASEINIREGVSRLEQFMKGVL